MIPVHFCPLKGSTLTASLQLRELPRLLWGQNSITMMTSPAAQMPNYYQIIMV